MPLSPNAYKRNPQFLAMRPITKGAVPEKSQDVLLAWIADALSVPVESFPDECVSTSWDDVSELLRAYASTTNSQS